MKNKIIIYVSIFGVLAAIILSNAKEIQNYIDKSIQPLNGHVEEDATNLFVNLPVEW